MKKRPEANNNGNVCMCTSSVLLARIVKAVLKTMMTTALRNPAYR